MSEVSHTTHKYIEVIAWFSVCGLSRREWRGSCPHPSVRPWAARPPPHPTVLPYWNICWGMLAVCVPSFSNLSVALTYLYPMARSVSRNNRRVVYGSSSCHTSTTSPVHGLLFPWKLNSNFSNSVAMYRHFQHMFRSFNQSVLPLVVGSCP